MTAIGLANLSHVLEVAISDWGLPLAKNVVKLVRRPVIRNERSRRLTGDDEQCLIDGCDAGMTVCAACAAKVGVPPSPTEITLAAQALVDGAAIGKPGCWPSQTVFRWLPRSASKNTTGWLWRDR